MRHVLAVLLACALASAAHAGRIDDADPLDRHEPPAKGRPARDSVGFVIVTPRSLRDEFLKLAHAHRKHGLAAGVWTLESIVDAWPGRDDAERVRAFLADAYRAHGAHYVLLGGDATLVPMRRAAVVSLTGGPATLATDQYYACLDGTWNADGDTAWGELATDSVDVRPELAVGRAPIANRNEARRFVAKTRDALEAPPAPGGRVVLAAERFAGGAVDGAFATEFLRPFFAPLPGVHVTRLYENSAGWPGSFPESRIALLDTLGAGFDLGVLVGAGAPGIFNAGVDNGTVDQVTAADLRALANPHPGIVVFHSAYTCVPAPQPSIGEAFVNAPDGGAVAVVGPTDVQFAGQATAFVREVLKQVYVFGERTIGDAYSHAIRELVQSGPPGEALRLATHGQALLGDPALPVRPAPAPPAVIATLAGDVPAATGATTALAIDARGPLRGPRGGVAAVAASADAPTLAFTRRAPGATGAPIALALAVPPELAGARYDVAVFDPTGRRVRALDRGTARAGTLSLAWDLRDDTGVRVSSGVYFVAVRVGGQFVTGRVAVVR